VAFAAYTWYVLAKLRAAVRVRYRIPPRAAPLVPGCVEDACVSFWCGCCSVAQLARQTADCDNEEDVAAGCCTRTGLAPPRTSSPSVKANGAGWEAVNRGDDDDESVRRLFPSASATVLTV
jgi:hypothetical protein